MAKIVGIVVAGVPPLITLLRGAIVVYRLFPAMTIIVIMGIKIFPIEIHDHHSNATNAKI